MKTSWNKYLDSKMNDVMNFSEGYKDFLNHGKTERECVASAIALAEAKGFKNLKEVSELHPNDKVYLNNRGKNICFFVVGQNSIVEGMNILGAHIDSPRIDLKPTPLYETDGLCLFDTHYYGGIKNYQWVATPMALHGVVCKKDGSVIKVVIGEDENEPVIGISDLLIHLAKDQMAKKAASVVESEDLNAICGSIPVDAKEETKDPVKANVLAILKEKYGFEEEDFLSAELSIVPAGKARDFGLDRGMVMSYGHDDRICAYTSLMALLDIENPARTSCCILTDKEEVGSIGNTGACSRFFENAICELLDKSGCYSEMNFRHTLDNSKMLSSDVSAGYDPNYASAFESKNAAFLGRGLCFNKYTGSHGKSGCNDANAEYVAKVRKVMDDNNVDFQLAELGRVDQGGGGTIAYILANLNMDVIDAGIAVLNMHSCYELASKVDIYEGYRGYISFLKDMD